MTETTGSIINIVNTGQVITLTVKYIVASSCLFI